MKYGIQHDELRKHEPNSPENRLLRQSAIRNSAVTNYWPRRGVGSSYDWCAHLVDYDGAPDSGFQPLGYGATEAEAITGLIELIEDYDGTNE